MNAAAAEHVTDLFNYYRALFDIEEGKLPCTPYWHFLDQLLNPRGQAGNWFEAKCAICLDKVTTIPWHQRHWLTKEDCEALLDASLQRLLATPDLDILHSSYVYTPADRIAYKVR